jgi:hypothetical protein
MGVVLWTDKVGCGVNSGDYWEKSGREVRKDVQISYTNHHNFAMSGFADAPVEPLLFQPYPFEVELLASFRNIPRYLFRLHGPTMAGTTTHLEVMESCVGDIWTV